MDRFHVHQVLEFLDALVGHAGTPGDQLLIIFDLRLLPLAADQQEIVFSALIGKPDIKPEVPVITFFIINLANFSYFIFFSS